jgi:RNA polymerase sigma-70 factor (ECF subfamily)
VDTVEYLYETYRSDVYRYLLGMTRDPDLAEDLVSDTFCAALLSVDSFREEGSVKNWLLTIARNKWLDHLRKRHPVEDVDLAELYIADPSPGPEQRAITREAARRALELLKREDLRTQAVVKMRIDGYSYYEIARKLGIREGSARVIDFRARKKLRDQLSKEGYDGSVRL